MKKKLVLLITWLVILSLAFGCSKKSPAPEQAPGAKSKRGAAAVKTVRVTEGQINEKMTLSGTLEALNSADVVAKTAGKVAALYVDVGSTVSAGQTLLTLEAEDLRAAVQAAEANLATAQVNYDLSLSKYRRGQELVKSAAVSQWDFEENYEGAYRKAAAALKSAQAALAQSQARYHETVLKSPINGVVTARNINVGELAGSSGPLFSISNLDKVVVLVNVNEQQVNKFVAGQQVTVRVSAATQNSLTGTVTNIAMAADPKLKAYPVKIELANKDRQLKPGMFAEVIWEKATAKTLLVPRQAVVTRDGVTRVFVLEQGVVKERQVHTGPADSQNVAVLSGLRPGEQVIVDNLDNLQDGLKLSPQTNQGGSEKKPGGKGEER
ncbi:efflux RND transporter periplasmic adaptor subunit [Desulforamulus hydrothermalis]|uniref:Efflux transporter, RND family, MFP subunit n=1 Tax=Desulforamulus hydrothermalis Lam5 = DSM 18033 TaxID=1121428 RepID=K8DZ47_9FIRM|nr:efflux RND transporter periplasmic adaptor subunit [Desulforamulus hydrothermalis]CCO08170.1 Efflux transporter, RND family, MFP subunit [Desulforamulus hydrothermalis Lam5 = DSM 18033]SHH23282.1 Barrel-sandwich domain of CusB or HlyD membrane-fusion [Desulforamulus hydrothermalis Lam5 = DSM 18033]